MPAVISQSRKSRRPLMSTSGRIFSATIDLSGASQLEPPGRNSPSNAHCPMAASNAGTRSASANSSQNPQTPEAHRTTSKADALRSNRRVALAGFGAWAAKSLPTAKAQSRTKGDFAVAWRPRALPTGKTWTWPPADRASRGLGGRSEFEGARIAGSLVLPSASRAQIAGAKSVVPCSLRNETTIATTASATATAATISTIITPISLAALAVDGAANKMTNVFGITVIICQVGPGAKSADCPIFTPPRRLFVIGKPFRLAKGYHVVKMQRLRLLCRLHRACLIARPNHPPR